MSIMITLVHHSQSTLSIHYHSIILHQNHHTLQLFHNNWIALALLLKHLIIFTEHSIVYTITLYIHTCIRTTILFIQHTVHNAAPIFSTLPILHTVHNTITVIYSALKNTPDSSTHCSQEYIYIKSMLLICWVNQVKLT